MDIPGDGLVDEANFCAEFQQLGQIVEELHGFSFTNTTVPLFGEQPYTGITCIHFDQKENLLWIANDQGHATSYYRAELTVYSKFWWSLDKNDLIPNEIVTTDDYVIFIGKSHIALFTRGGAPVFRYKSDTITDILFGHWAPDSPTFLYFGGEQNFIGVFDLGSKKELKRIETDEDCCLLRSTDRYLVCASKSGQITVRTKDFSQYKVVAKTVAHNAGIEDMDVVGNYLITCGNSARQNGIIQGDNFMKVYDVRNLGAQAPVGFNRPPKKVRFVPGLDGCICASTGLSLFMVDILNNKTTMFVTFNLPSDGIEVSKSGQAIAAFINNYTPYLQIFCNSIDPPFSLFDIDSVFPVQNEEPFVPFDDKTPLAVFPVAYSQNYCSDKWSGPMSTQHYLHTPKINSNEQANTAKDVKYVKSDHASNKLIAGFNVWSFDDKHQGKQGPATSSQTPTADDNKPPTLQPSGSVSREQTPDPQTMAKQNVKCASPPSVGIMHNYKHATEFVPGRSHHSKVETKSDTSKMDEYQLEAERIQRRLKVNIPKPSDDRLHNMSFNEFREMAKKVKSESSNNETK